MSEKKLSLQDLSTALSGGAAAFRLTLKLEAVSPKVFPPTYEGGKYATEERVIDGQRVPCVLLDSVPSQANRMETALQDAWEGGEIQVPVVSTDFAAIEHPGIPKITSFQAPHRIADAILRDSYFGDAKKKVKFRNSEIGKELDQLSTGYATPLLKHAPHSLVFGMWDSTGKSGGLGVKFSRAIISEIIGVKAYIGVNTSSRIDPLNIKLQAGPVYRAADGENWTLDPSAALMEKGKPVKFKNKTDGDAKKEGKPSSINHGNIKPTVTKDKGFTIEYAEQTTVLSFPALRRLRFPAKRGEQSTSKGDAAARTYLAALGLLGATLAVENGYDLRSRCILRAKDAVVWYLLGRPGGIDKAFSLDKAAAIQLYSESLAALQEAKLPIELKEQILKPTDELVNLVKESMSLSNDGSGEDE